MNSSHIEGTLIIEVSNQLLSAAGYSPEKLFNFLESMDYIVRDAANPKLYPHKCFEGDILAVHKLAPKCVNLHQ